MKKIYRILVLSILFLLLSSIQKIPPYPLNKKGKPSKFGIEYYVKQNESKIISEFQKLVHDSLYDVYITVDDISQYNNNEEGTLGYCLSGQGTCEIIITNQETYSAYEVSTLSRSQRQRIAEANNFVKGTILHELGHVYFNQVILEMRLDSIKVSPEYNNFSMIPRPGSAGSKFIEEGICEYIPTKMRENIILSLFVPKSIEDIMSKENNYNVMYKYSSEYLRAFIDYYGVKQAIRILVWNKPPSLREIFYPAEFFTRIKTTIK